MKRHFWLIAIVAALSVLQAPLCAFACTESADTQSSSTSVDPPCHEENSDSSSPGESNSHEDCGCDFTAEMFVSQPIDSHSTTRVEILLSPALRLELIESSTTQEPLIARSGDLPPPDILLLKSTLII